MSSDSEQSEGFRKDTSRKSRKRKLKDKTDTPNSSKKSKSKKNVSFSTVRESAAASFIKENDEFADNECEEDKNMDVDDPAPAPKPKPIQTKESLDTMIKNIRDDVNNVPTPEEPSNKNEEKIVKPAKDAKFLDLFVTKTPVEMQEQNKFAPALTKIICEGAPLIGVQRKIIYNFYKTKNPSTIRIKTMTIDDHIILQKIFALQENDHPLGGESKCELPNYLQTESGHHINHKKREPVWLVLKGVGRNITRFELKEELTSENSHPITLIRLKNASGHYLSTVKVLFPAEEAEELLKKGGIEISDMSLKVESCHTIPSPQILQCYRCQRIGHNAKVCKGNLRCPRCSKSHQVSQCDIPLNDFSKYHCALCNQSGHGSNFSKCPKRQECVSKLKDKKSGPKIQPPPHINDFNHFPPLDKSTLPPPQTHPLQFPALRAVLEGVVSGMIEIFQHKETPTIAKVMTSISNSLERHSNIRLDLNHETYQAKLIATRPTVPTTLPINTGMFNNNYPFNANKVASPAVNLTSSTESNN